MPMHTLTSFIHSLHFYLQEFNRAYNAYSAALKLSPVGPSSHGTFVHIIYIDGMC